MSTAAVIRGARRLTDPRTLRAVGAALLVLSASVPSSAQGTAAEWPALVKRYEEQVMRASTDPHARFTLAMLYARDGRLVDGYQQLRDADQMVGATQRTATVRQIASDAERLVRLNPQDLLARYRLAFSRYFLNDYPGATAEMERIVALDPRNDWGYGYLGQAYATLGKLDQAIITWERGLAVNANNAVLHYVLALAYTKKDDKKKAAQHFAAAYRDRTLYEYVTGQRR